jgi:uncharacterized protein YggE
MMRKWMIAAAMALVFGGVMIALSGCGATTVTTTSGPAPDTVTAVGTGTGTATPDTAEFTLGVTSTAKDRLAAQDGASKASAAIIAAIEGAGIASKDIRTTQISLAQQFDPTGRTVTGYQASQSVDVKTKLLGKVGAVIAAATTAGATDVSGPTFSLSDTNAARIDAIDKAMADAKARATAIAKAAGRALGRVISVTEADTNPVVPLASTGLVAGTASAVPPVATGQVETQTQLSVVFALQ